MNDINVDEAFMKITKDVHTKAQAGNNTSIIKSSSTTFKPGQTGISNTADIRNPPPKKSWCSVI
jgi:phage-related protein